MELHAKILASLVKLTKISSSIEEKWGYIRLKGNKDLDILTRFDELEAHVAEVGFTNLLQFEINNATLDTDDRVVYKDNPEKITSWKIELNKLPVINSKNSDGWHYNIFTSQENCKQWLTTIEPLSQDCPFNYINSIRILVEGLASPFGGESSQFLSPSSTIESRASANPQLPDRDRLRENIHFVTTENINVNLKAYCFTGGTGSDLEKEFIYKSCIALSVSLVDEYYSSDKIIIDGIKRIVLKMDNGCTQIDYQFYQKLLELIAWIFEDRVSIRKKLFNERLSLDLVPTDTFIESLIKCMPGAFMQAKERYSFVIIERKDAYVKELKELLKDIRTQSELYSVKIRNLLSNFLRDLLAAIVLIGFTIFTKFTDNANLANQDLLKYVFYGLSIYYVLSILMQSIVDTIDINVSKKEMLYWKNATKELLPEKEFRAHIDSSLKGRRYSLRIIYPLFIICYLVIAYTCYKYPEIFASIIKK